MISPALKNIEGLLFDLDGVMYVGSAAIPGAAEAIRALKEKGLPLRYTTNTTVLSNASLIKKLQALDLPIASSEVFGAISAAQAFLREQGRPRCHFLLTNDPLGDFTEFEQTKDNPDFIVIGDVCKAWSYDLMHECFRMIMAGAEMVALHKGRYWQTETGLQMDIGAFVAGLEYVTGKTATVVGKPSKSFFQLALNHLGLPPEKVAMVGDDVISDIGGAQAAGMCGILVKTGKYRPEAVERSGVTPDLIVESVASLPDIL